MAANGFPIPILFLVYRRPDTTRQVFERIRAIQPNMLYVAADGPKPDDPAEATACAAAREIATKVDWGGGLYTLFRDQNLGCGRAVSSAISWFFEAVPAGIILEDDCLPSMSFFQFAKELLEYYRGDDRIMHVGGNSFQFGRRRGAASYYFSMFPNIWGWASWRRAWRHYDFSLRPEWEVRDTWDIQWKLSVERAQGMSITPNANLVRNIGFGAGGTHTVDPDRLSRLPLEEMEFPIRHPAAVAVDKAADTFAYYAHFRNVRFLGWIWLYQLLDLLQGRLKRLKRKLFGPRRSHG